MIDVRRATQSIARLAILKFFPANPTAQTEIVAIVCEMATTNDQVDWLVKRVLALWNGWEGPKELRAVFCSKFKPQDGIEAYSDLPEFRDGIPSERESFPALPAALPLRQIGSGEPVSASPELHEMITGLAKAKMFKRFSCRP